MLHSKCVRRTMQADTDPCFPHASLVGSMLVPFWFPVGSESRGMTKCFCLASCFLAFFLSCFMC